MAIAEAELGVREIAGPRAQERILGYWKICGHTHQSSDEVPWCAIFVGAMLTCAGYNHSKSAMALSYLNYGQKLDAPVVGCIAVLSRGKPPSGHVAFVAGFNSTHVLLLGGNQGDAVSSVWFPRSSVRGYRMPTALDRLAPPEPVTPPEPEAPVPASLAPETAAPPAEANAPAEPHPPAAPVFPKLKDAKQSWTVTGVLLAFLGTLLGYLHEAASLAIALSADALGVVNELGPVKGLLAGAGLNLPRLALSMTVAGLTLAVYRRLFKDTKPR